MGIVIYADPADFVAYTGSAIPDNITALLRSASILVREATVSAVYDVDDDNLPTDTDILTAMRDATCAHAAALDAASIDPLAAGTEAGISSTSIGGAAISYLGHVGSEARRQALATSLAPEAALILRAAGLLATSAQTYRG